MTTQSKLGGGLNLLGSDISEQPKAPENSALELQIAKETPAIMNDKPKPAQTDDKRYEILSTRLSYWLDVFKAVMMVHVITSHYHQEIGSQDYDKPAQLLLPHVLVSQGWGMVRSFFLLAGFFAMVSFDKMHRLYLNDTKSFLKQFVLKQFKRYFQMHAVLFMYGLGLGAFFNWVLGERGDVRHYLGPRAENYWIDFYMPFYWPGRVWRNIGRVCGASWFNNSMAQMESLFYIAFFATYFLRKKLNDLKFGLIITVGTLVVIVLMQVIFDPERHEDFYFYWCGVATYWIRMSIIKTERGKKIVNFIYSTTRKNTIIVWTLSIGVAWAWLIVNRVMYQAHVVFLAILIMFDLFPYGKLPESLESFRKQMKLLQVEIYLSHQSFIWDGHPRFYPEIIPRDVSIISPTYVHWLVAWLLTTQMLVYAYPVYFVTKPFSSIPQWVYDVITKKERGPDFKKNFWMGVAGITIGFALIILNQANAYGY